MVPPICPWNVDNASPNVSASTSSNSRKKPPTASLLTLLSSNPPPPDYKKTDEELVGEFLRQGICRCMGIKDYLPKQASFCEYTWEVVACRVITSKERSGPDIWPETPN